MSILEFAIKFFQDSGVAIYFSIAIMAVGTSSERRTGRKS